MSWEQAHVLAVKAGFVFHTVGELVDFYRPYIQDPCDDCTSWAGNLPYVDICPDCEQLLKDTGHDEHDNTRCPDCAHASRSQGT